MACTALITFHFGGVNLISDQGMWSNIYMVDVLSLF